MPRITLPPAQKISTDLADAIQRRNSFEQVLSDKPLSLETLGTLLGLALGMRGSEKRNYPSGGALYPIETYLIGNTVEGHSPGVFHYHPKAHALEQLWNLPQDFSMKKMLPSTNTPLAPLLIAFTSVWERSAKKYGTLAYSHSLVETGHMAQNILLVGTALGLQTRPLAGCNDSYFAATLDLDPEIEGYVHGVLLSSPVEKKSI